MDNDNDDAWLRQLAAEDLTPPAPQAAVADRVAMTIRRMRVRRNGQVFSALAACIAATVAIWLFCVAIPAFYYLSSPVVGIQHQLVSALNSAR